MALNGPIIIDVSDSSDDEVDDIVLPSRRRVRPSPNNTLPNTIDLVESDESEASESDGLAADYMREQLAATRGNLVEERENIFDADTEESENDENVARLAQGISRRRDAFKQLLATMESPDDIDLLYPKSLHPGVDHQEEISNEEDVLNEFIPLNGFIPDHAQEEENTFLELQLYNFSIYRGILHAKDFNGQFESPHIVCSEKDTGIYYLDGIIQHSGQKRHIIGAVIRDVNIGGLCDTSTHTSKHHIWVQTEYSRRQNSCWYRLCVASPEYQNIWAGFLWLADLNKHVIDYLFDACASEQAVCLTHFEALFWARLVEWHGEDEDFVAWGDSCRDFRMHLCIHAAFLRNQAHSMSGEEAPLLQHPVWKEIGAGEFDEDQQSSSKREKTVVTPNIGSTFLQSFPKWGPRRFNLLSLTPMSETVSLHRETRRLSLGIPDKFGLQKSTAKSSVQFLLEEAATVNQPISQTANELLGQVVVVRPRVTHSSSRARSYEQHFQFAFVRGPTNSQKAVKVIWLTMPSDTICGTEYDGAFYPITNELFYSDRCNCRPVAVGNIVGVYTVSMSHELSASTDTIIQLHYREEDAALVTPIEAELSCSCQSMMWTPKPQALGSLAGDAITKLQTMSLFSGAGLLDYSLEESGAFETVVAIDHNENAILTHAANSKSGNCIHIVDSVNIQLRRCLDGDVKMPEFDCITAGCPCKGFSLLNGHRKNKNSQRNCSLLASTLSWIELFLPKFVLIENVPRMDHTPADKELANACAQAICCLVALGYQARKMLLTAYEYGSPTLRKRLFIVAAAPGVALPNVPEATHGVDTDLQPIMTVSDVLQDLKPIHNDTVINIQDPSHIPMHRLKPQIEWRVSLRNIVKRIPKMAGQGLYQAHASGLLSRDQNEWYYSQSSDERKGSRSKSLRRVDPSAPFRTIVTMVSPLDSRFGGEIVHPWEDRVLSLEEAKRGQGIPDSFIMVANLMKQVEQAGNGVAWQVGAALGRSFKDAMMESSNDNNKDPESGKELSALSDTNSLQQESIRTLKQEQVAEKMTDSGTIEVGAQSPAFSPSRMTKREEPEQADPKSVSKAMTDASNPRHSRRQLTGSESEEVYEISENEKMIIPPDGNYKYHFSRRGKLTRRASSTKRHGKLEPVIEIPSRHKRAASIRSTPPFHQDFRTFPTGKEDESDSDIEFLGSKPISKKARMF